MNDFLEQLKQLDPNDPGRWPTAYRLGAIGLILVVAIGVGCYFLAWKPKKPELDQVRLEETQLLQTLEQKARKAANLDAYKAQLQEMLEPLMPRAAGALKPEEVAQLLRQGRISLVDTRETPVFNHAHIDGAINIPLEEIEGRLAELHMLTGAPVVYCRAGDKTKDLAQRLAEQGVPVSFMEGGVLGWEAVGFRLIRP